MRIGFLSVAVLVALLGCNSEEKMADTTTGGAAPASAAPDSTTGIQREGGMGFQPNVTDAQLENRAGSAVKPK